MSNSITGRNQFENQDFDAYGSFLRSSNAFPKALGIFPGIQSIGDRISRLEGFEISHTRHSNPMDLLEAANESNHQPQGLSLSLGSHLLVPSDGYRQRSLNLGLMTSNHFISGEEAREACNPGVDHLTDHYYFDSTTLAPFSRSLNHSPSSSYSESFAAIIGSSRYLKPLQSLLEEFVDVGGNVVDRINKKYVEELFHGGRIGARRLSSELKVNLYNDGILLAEKRELQVKITKLITLLDEVEGRYEKYYHELEEAVSSFEMIAGLGAAKCYTALALQAMSRHFCSLREAILSQINIHKRKLLRDLPNITRELSQLSLFDKHTRHTRMSLQQLGIVQTQHQVSPIRGLPETSVSILRSWLFEHFLHPYPNDSEKLMLASQIGLTKTQVSNWFINARVRLWKPMIEEMYKEEFGESSEDSNPPTREDITG